MISAKRLCLVAIRLVLMGTPLHAQVPAEQPRVYASNETATRPWSAPVGHRQPRATDFATPALESRQAIDPENAEVDRKINGVCRGC